MAAVASEYMYSAGTCRTRRLRQLPEGCGGGGRCHKAAVPLLVTPPPHCCHPHRPPSMLSATLDGKRGGVGGRGTGAPIVRRPRQINPENRCKSQLFGAPRSVGGVGPTCMHGAASAAASPARLFSPVHHSTIDPPLCMMSWCAQDKCYCAWYHGTRRTSVTHDTLMTSVWCAPPAHPREEFERVHDSRRKPHRHHPRHPAATAAMACTAFNALMLTRGSITEGIARWSRIWRAAASPAPGTHCLSTACRCLSLHALP